MGTYSEYMFSSASEQEMLAAIEQEIRNVLGRLRPNCGASPNNGTDIGTDIGTTTSPKNHMYGMLYYHMGWVDQQFKPAQNKAGKRVRPMLCLLCCQAAGGDWRQAVPAAAAIELLHNFSLIHDDIQDESRTRRDRFTLWHI